MENDKILAFIAGVGVGVLLTIVVMRGRDEGTLLLRDEKGSIIGLLPMGDGFLEKTIYPAGAVQSKYGQPQLNDGEFVFIPDK